MIKVAYSRKFSSIIVFFFSVLTACSSTTNPLRFYSFHNINSATEKRVRLQNISVGIAAVSIPRLLDRPQIVSRKSTNEIVRAESHQWGGEIREEITNVIASGLSFYLNSPNVFVYPKQSRYKPDYELFINVSRFDGELGESVLLEIDWQLEAFRGPKSLTVNQIKVERKSQTVTYADYVSSMNTLLIEATKEIAKGINQIHGVTSINQ